MLLNYEDILEMVNQGKIVEHATRELVNGTSLDITLGNNLKIESLAPTTYTPILRHRDPLRMIDFEMDDEQGYVVSPGEFVLGCSQQVFHLPLWLSADLKLKSSVARLGITNLLAGWCDPGWYDSVLTLELSNCTRNHPIQIFPGDRIGQVVFFKHKAVPEKNSYRIRGRYNQQRRTEGIKP